MAITDWKDATGTSVPGALGYFLLTGQVAIPTADSVDEGLNPDLIEPLGSIVLHPLQTETRFIGTADADPLTIALVDIPIKMNRAGQLFVIDGEAGARILNTSDPHLNPTNIPYEVRFEFEDIDETVKPRIAPFTILPPPPRADGEPWILDITELATVAVTGQPISVEMARALVAAGWEATRKVLATAEKMKATTQEAKTAAQNAAGSAATAETKATEAAESASHAATSAADADVRATAAADSASKAAGSAATAEAKATEAAERAANAQGAAVNAELAATIAANKLSETKNLIATAPIEFQWETVQGGGGTPQVKGSWRRTGETEWKSVGVINSGIDGDGVTSATVNPEGHLILSMSRGGTIDAGSVIGPPPVIEAGEIGVSPDGTYEIEIPQTGNGKYAVNLRMPPPPGVSQDLVKSIADKVINDLELLALAGL
nr:MAG TPA: hypothetical protein [Caudoviricetes sp.]